jgi:sialate O-acetylesterase
LPADWAGKSLVLDLGAIDKGDVTYFNNEAVGQLDPLLPNAWCTPRHYPVPGHLVKAGRNTIAVRVVSHVYGGGLSGPAALMRLTPADNSRAAIPLAGEWRLQVEHNYGRVTPFPGVPAPQGPGNPNSPYILYNSMVAPLVPYAIRGATWYQGESNAGKAFAYRNLLPALIRDWHRVWGQGEFPFLIVQLANYMARRDGPQECAWAELRDAQLHTARTVPQAGLAVIIDIGEATDIHPRNKQDVGARLAAWALAHTYQVKGVVASGPLYCGMTAEGSRLRLSFDYVDGGLVARGGELQGFAVAGADRKFVWAKARIEGERIVVWSDAVAQPVAARYAWADNPLCNLYNQAGLPASPFRTDNWPGVTDQTPA